MERHHHLAGLLPLGVHGKGAGILGFGGSPWVILVLGVQVWEAKDVLGLLKPSALAIPVQDTIHIPGIELGFKRPVLFERHAVGGEYGAGWKKAALQKPNPKNSEPNTLEVEFPYLRA